jgi:GNAT superfamily N-acetyltransferase
LGARASSGKDLKKLSKTPCALVFIAITQLQALPGLLPTMPLLLTFVTYLFCPEFRKKGLSKWLMQTIVKHPDLQGLRRWSLATADAHGLYQQFGFSQLSKPENFGWKYLHLTKKLNN